MEETGELSKVWGLPTPTHSEMEKKKKRIIAIRRELVGARMDRWKKEERVGGRGR